MSVPVHCPSCGLRFPSQQFAFSNSTGITLSGNRESCPRCGRMANVQDGVYDFVGDTISSFRRLRTGEIQRFQTVLKAADSGEISREAVASEAASLDPALGKFVSALQAAGGIPLLIMLISLYLQYESLKDSAADQEAVLTELRASNAHQEQLIEEMRELIEAQGTQEPPPYSPQKPNTSHTRPTESSGSDRASRRRAWKAEKKASKDNSIKFKR